ncbi:MAG: hypothetical protein JST00_11950 [Deltaproteobacteria bacterium]|nr:hypothetical protein [Deltaproteobacteria bacterium]
MTSRRWDLGIVAGALALGACGGREAAAPATPTAAAAGPAAKGGAEPAKFDFEALLRREMPALPMRKIAGEILSAEVEASAEPKVVLEEKSFHVSVPLGGQSPMECWVYEESKDPAGTMGVMAASLRKNLDVKLFAPTDVFVAGEHAVLTTHAIYLADTPTGKGAGQIKLAFYNDPLAPSLCTHDEPGYSASFARIAKHFFETVQRRDRALSGKPAKEWEVSVTKLDGKPVGFDEHRTYDHPETKLTTTVDVSATLYPRSVTESRSQDSITTRTFDATGDLLELEYVSAAGGELEMKVTLKRLAAGRYSYGGEQAGKPITGKFQTNDKVGLATDKRIAARIKNELLTGKATSFKVEEYVASIDPTAPLESTYEMESIEQRRVRASLGAIRMVTTVDAEGKAKGASANLGRATLTIERIASGKR